MYAKLCQDYILGKLISVALGAVRLDIYFRDACIY